MNLPFLGETFFCPEQAGTWIPRNRGRTTLFYLVGKLSGVLLLHFNCILIAFIPYYSIAVLILHMSQMLNHIYIY